MAGLVLIEFSLFHTHTTNSVGRWKVRGKALWRSGGLGVLPSGRGQRPPPAFTRYPAARRSRCLSPLRWLRPVGGAVGKQTRCVRSFDNLPREPVCSMLYGKVYSPHMNSTLIYTKGSLPVPMAFWRSRISRKTSTMRTLYHLCATVSRNWGFYDFYKWCRSDAIAIPIVAGIILSAS